MLNKSLDIFWCHLPRCYFTDILVNYNFMTAHEIALTPTLYACYNSVIPNIATTRLVKLSWTHMFVSWKVYKQSHSLKSRSTIQNILLGILNHCGLVLLAKWRHRSWSTLTQVSINILRTLCSQITLLKYLSDIHVANDCSYQRIS